MELPTAIRCRRSTAPVTDAGTHRRGAGPVPAAGRAQPRSCRAAAVAVDQPARDRPAAARRGAGRRLRRRAGQPGSRQDRQQDPARPTAGHHRRQSGRAPQGAAVGAAGRDRRAGQHPATGAVRGRLHRDVADRAGGRACRGAELLGIGDAEQLLGWLYVGGHRSRDAGAAGSRTRTSPARSRSWPRCRAHRARASCRSVPSPGERRPHRRQLTKESSDGPLPQRRRGPAQAAHPAPRPRRQRSTSRS